MEKWIKRHASSPRPHLVQTFLDLSKGDILAVCLGSFQSALSDITSSPSRIGGGHGSSDVDALHASKTQPIIDTASFVIGHLQS
jgi:hypothetical protein